MQKEEQSEAKNITISSSFGPYKKPYYSASRIEILSEFVTDFKNRSKNKNFKLEFRINCESSLNYIYYNIWDKKIVHILSPIYCLATLTGYIIFIRQS